MLNRWGIRSFNTSEGNQQKTLLFCPSEKKIVLLSFFISNTSLLNDANITYELSNNGNIEQTFQLKILANTFLNLDSKTSLRQNDVLKITSDINDVSIFTSGLELDSDYIEPEYWEPKQLNNLELWLDAADESTILLDGSNKVEQWSDKSGNENHFGQSSLERRPSTTASIDGKNAVSFNGHFLECNFGGTTQNTFLFMVMRINATAQTEYCGFFSSCLGTEGTNNTWQFDIGGSARGGAGKIGVFGNNSSGTLANRALSPSDYSVANYIVVLDVKTNEYSISVDGSSFNTQTLTSFSPTLKTVAVGRNRAGNNFINSDIAEVIMLNSGSSDIHRIEGYLAHKWGLTSNLPTEHPYKTIRPNYFELDEIEDEIIEPEEPIAGTLYTWGRNNYGQLGDGSTTQRTSPVQIGSDTWLSISCGVYHSLGLKSNGTLWAWGRNNYSQLGDGSTTQRTSPVQIGSDTWLSVNTGAYYSLGIKSNGTLWAWGANGYGQLGDGSTTTRTSPVQIGSDTWLSVSCGAYHSLGIKTNGTLWAWGLNQQRQLGDGSTTQRTSPVQIGSDTWTYISCGNYHSFGIKSNGTLWAWGENLYGKLGDGSTTDRTSPVQIGADTWLSVSGGENYSLGIKLNGTLWAWGRNSDGQLGDGSTTQRTSPVQIGADTWLSVKCNSADYTSSHSLGIKMNNTLWAWGQNSYGQLGDGTTTTSPRTSPVQIGSDIWLSISGGGYEFSIGIKKP